VSSGKRRFDGFAKPVHQPLRQRARGRHGDLLAQHGAHGQLVAVQRTGHAQAVAVRKGAVQHGVDGLRVGVQVQRGAQPADHQRQHLAQRIAHAQHHLAAGFVKLAHQPAGVRLAAGVDAQRAAQPHGRCVRSLQIQ
jgi:hypothetical protein